MAKSNNNDDRKRLPISAQAVIDNIVFSKNESWAYYRVSNQVFDFLSVDGKAALAMRIANAFNSLMTDRQEPVECHLIVTTTPVDVDSWAYQVKEISKMWEGHPGFEEYINEEEQHLRSQQYMKRVAYLGINLGKRGELDLSRMNFLDMGLRGAKEALKEWWGAALSVPNAEVSAKEESQARLREENFYRVISVNPTLNAHRCTAEDILLLIKRQFYPAMPAPYLDVDHGSRLGPGDLSLETCSVLENKYRWIKIIQQMDDVELAGYRATLSFSKFPKQTNFPEGSLPFFYLPTLWGLPFTCFARFTLLPSEKVKKELAKKKKEQRDELENLSAGQDAYDSIMNGLGSDVSESLENMQQIESILTSDKTPWVEGSYHIVVETPPALHTKDDKKYGYHPESQLQEFCSRIKQAFAEKDIIVNWTSGDQAQLFLEQMPGDYQRVKSFKQITNLLMIPYTGFNLSSDVGDPVYGSDMEI